MTFQIISQFIVSAAVIIFAAQLLAKASDEMARLTGISHLFIGSIFLAASTSAPEFFVNIRATMEGVPNLASGDLLGASLMNLITLSVLALIFRETKQENHQVGVGFASILAAALTLEVALLIYFQPTLRFFGIGIGSFLMVGTYLAGMRYLFKNTQVTFEEKNSVSTRSFRKSLKPMMRFLMGVAVIFFASPLLVSSMEEISLKTGLGNSMIGATLLALTTTFPELASSLTAARMKLFDLAIGNIVGSNAFNMLIFVLMDWIWPQPPIWKYLTQQNLILAGIAVLNMLILAGSWGKYKKKPVWAKSVGTLLILLLSLVCYFLLFLWRGKFPFLAL